MTKPRILFCGEATYTNSGFAVYQNEVMKRFHESGKYEIAELAAYGDTSDPTDNRWRSVPWKFYPVKPNMRNQAECDSYHSNDLNQFGQWKFEATCIDFKPDVVMDIRDWWMCLTADTPIVCKDGLKPVQSIAIGDSVLSHTGQYRPVTHVFPERVHAGTFVKLTPSHCRLPVTLTEKHPVLAIRRKKVTGNLPNFAKEKPTWVDSNELKKGDILCFPRGRHKTSSPRFSADLSRLCGYYAAEGCILYEGRKSLGKLKGVQLTLNNREWATVHDIVKLFEENFNSPSFSVKHGKGTNNATVIIRVYDKAAAEFLNLHVPGVAKTKCLSSDLFNSTKLNTTQFLCGLVRGDGGYNHDTGRPSFCTSSHVMAMQVFQLFVRHGMLPSFGRNRNTLKGKVYYRYIFGFGDSEQGFLCFWNGGGIVKRSKRIDDKYAYLTVDEVEQFQDSQPVYNFEVARDNSYTSSFAMHNCEHQQRSPVRPYFHWAIMPTVDSAPQDEQWLSTYANADAVFAYTDWGLEVLRQSSGKHINLKRAAPPGADAVFKPVPDKRAHRRSMSFDEDAFIIGTVMRNQVRKLYPDLIEAFADFLKQAPVALAEKAYLYLHTSWPDLGWDIPKLIKEAGISHKCIFTYCCTRPGCGSVFPAHFSDSITHCIKCGEYTARFPNSNSGIGTETLANVYNFMDVYVQYATNEGFGMPMAEAAACGVPVMAVDYSAMSDVVRKVHGIPIAVQRYFRDAGTQTRRALPDNQDFVNKLIGFLTKPSAYRARMGFAASQAVKEHYSYDKTAKIWMDHIDSLTFPSHELTWNSPPKIHTPNLRVPDGLNDEEFVRWGMAEVAGRPDLVNSYTGLRMIRDISWGKTIGHMGGMYLNEMSSMGMQDRVEHFNRDIAMQRMLDICEMRNACERARCAS